jgi:hypothetical protein
MGAKIDCILQSLHDDSACRFAPQKFRHGQFKKLADVLRSGGLK